MPEQVLGEIVKRQSLLGVKKYRKLWRAMFANVLTTHDTQEEENNDDEEEDV